MKKLMGVFALSIVIVVSYAVKAQEKPVEAKAEKIVKTDSTLGDEGAKKTLCPKEMKECFKAGKCCEKCKGKECDGKCCEKCKGMCEKKCKEKCEKHGMKKSDQKQPAKSEEMKKEEKK